MQVRHVPGGGPLDRSGSLYSSAYVLFIPACYINRVSSCKARMRVMASKSSADHYGTRCDGHTLGDSHCHRRTAGRGFCGRRHGRLRQRGRLQLLRVHTVAGVSVLALTLFRIGWWPVCGPFAARRAKGCRAGRACRPGWSHTRLFLRWSIHHSGRQVGIGHDAAISGGKGQTVTLWRCDRTAPISRKYGRRASRTALAPVLLVLLVVLHVRRGCSTTSYARRDDTMTRMLP